MPVALPMRVVLPVPVALSVPVVLTPVTGAEEAGSSAGTVWAKAGDVAISPARISVPEEAVLKRDIFLMRAN
jgi:hypothetical protein